MNRLFGGAARAPVDRAIRASLPGMRLRAILTLTLLTAGCASEAPFRVADHYIRYVAVEVPVNEQVTMRWANRKLPLKVHLPAPPSHPTLEPEAILDSVRNGITDWTDVARPGVPSFVFVDEPGEADIPIVWETEASGDWYIAHCVYDANLMTRRFGVARILVTTQTGEKGFDLDLLYRVMLHEMGHALGLAGHSPKKDDIMYVGGVGSAKGLSERDRATLKLLYARPNGHRVTGARRLD